MTFEDENVLNVNGNPLPNHEGPKVNAVESSLEMQVKRDVRDVCMPMGLVYEALVKASRLKSGQGKEEEATNREKCFCQYHGKTMDHSIQKCEHFAERSPRANNHLLSRRSVSDKSDTSCSHP